MRSRNHGTGRPEARRGRHRQAVRTACLLKGGHLEEAGVKERLAGRSVVDILWCDGRTYEFTTPRQETEVSQTHGTGCTFAAALTAYVARGASLPGAAAQAQAFVAAALAHPLRAGRHSPLGIGRGV